MYHMQLIGLIGVPVRLLLLYGQGDWSMAICHGNGSPICDQEWTTINFHPQTPLAELFCLSVCPLTSLLLVITNAQLTMFHVTDSYVHVSLINSVWPSWYGDLDLGQHWLRLPDNSHQAIHWTNIN